MSDSRYTDNGDGTVTDTETKLIWAREDSWQTETIWVTWDEAEKYNDRINDIKPGGFNDWRMPNRLEGKTLYCPDKTIKDKYGNDLYMDPVFPQGGLPTIWLHEPMTGNDGYILDLRNGEIRTLYKSKSGRMAVRPVRGSYDLA
ncbi:MAG: DUF1566 domain-containing protein [Nitrospinaceae bacterium]